MTGDRLALATRVMRARKTSACGECGRWINVGEQIARITDPAGWVHIRCVPAVRRALNISTERNEP